MFIFKVSGNTIEGVVRNQKHAFSGQPRNWYPGELVLLSKNHNDLALGEKQIQYTMRLVNIRELTAGEAEKYWPGNEGRWRYLAECDNLKQVVPFDLADVLGEEARRYWRVMTTCKIASEHEAKVEKYLEGARSNQQVERVAEPHAHNYHQHQRSKKPYGMLLCAQSRELLKLFERLQVENENSRLMQIEKEVREVVKKLEAFADELSLVTLEI